MYIIVQFPKFGTHVGVKTWTVYPCEDDFLKSRSRKMNDGSGRTVGEVYEVVHKGIASPEEAIRLCSTPENTANRVMAAARQCAEYERVAGTKVPDIILKAELAKALC